MELPISVILLQVTVFKTQRAFKIKNGTGRQVDNLKKTLRKQRDRSGSGSRIRGGLSKYSTRRVREIDLGQAGLRTEKSLYVRFQIYLRLALLFHTVVPFDQWRSSQPDCTVTHYLIFSFLFDEHPVYLTYLRQKTLQISPYATTHITSSRGACTILSVSQSGRYLTRFFHMCIASDYMPPMTRDFFHFNKVE